MFFISSFIVSTEVIPVFNEEEKSIAEKVFKDGKF